MIITYNPYIKFDSGITLKQLANSELLYILTNQLELFSNSSHETLHMYNCFTFWF